MDSNVARDTFRQIIQKGIAPIPDIEALNAAIRSYRTIGKRVTKIHATPHGMRLLIREAGRHRSPNDPIPTEPIGYAGITAYAKPPSAETFTLELE